MKIVDKFTCMISMPFSSLSSFVRNPTNRDLHDTTKKKATCKNVYICKIYGWLKKQYLILYNIFSHNYPVHLISTLQQFFLLYTLCNLMAKYLHNSLFSDEVPIKTTINFDTGTQFHFEQLFSSGKRKGRWESILKTLFFSIWSRVLLKVG